MKRDPAKLFWPVTLRFVIGMSSLFLGIACLERLPGNPTRYAPPFMILILILIKVVNYTPKEKQNRKDSDSN